MKPRPQDAYQRFALVTLEANANREGLVSMSPTQIAKLTAIPERTVRRLLQRLEEDHWIEPNGQNAWKVTHTRARNRGTPLGVDLNQPVDSSNLVTPTATYSRGLPEQNAQKRSFRQGEPAGTGHKAGLGVENCPFCGGTGWMEIDPVANGHPAGNFTVDICTCRGGPSEKASSVYPPPKSPTAGLEPQQIVTNLVGTAAARRKLRSEEEAEARPSPLHDETVAPDSENGPGAGQVGMSD